MKQTKLLIFFILIVSLFAFTQIAFSREKIKGMRFDPSYYYGMNYTAQTLAERIVADAKMVGVNTIFMMAYNPTYGAFYKTSYPHTTVEGGFGSQDILEELIKVANQKNIRVVAWLPVNNFKKAWEDNPNWREKRRDGSDYTPSGNSYFLSPFNPDFRKWYERFLDDILNHYSGLDGIEGAEAVVDEKWDGSATYDTHANDAYLKAYPDGKLGDSNWRIFRAGALTNLHEILTQRAHAHNKRSYIVQTWAAKPDGNLMLSSQIRDGCGFDFDGILNSSYRPDYIIAELIWQQWVKEYNDKNTFNPEWTKQASKEFMNFVNGRAAGIVHIELTSWLGGSIANKEFEDSLENAYNYSEGADFYDHNQARNSDAWEVIRKVYKHKGDVPQGSIRWQSLENYAGIYTFLFKAAMMKS